MKSCWGCGADYLDYHWTEDDLGEFHLAGVLDETETMCPSPSCFEDAVHQSELIDEVDL